MFNKKLFILVILFSLVACSTSFAAVNVVVTGNPSIDSDGNVVTTNVSGIGGTNATKTFVAEATAIYRINNTMATPYGSVTDANYTTTFMQDTVALLGNLTQGYGFANNTRVPVCSNVGITLPTTFTNFTCNVSSIMTSNPTYLYTEVIALTVTGSFVYDYAEVNITAGSTVITALPYTMSSGSYILTSNLSNGSNGITVGSSNVDLNCQGFTIQGNYTNITYGIVSGGFNNVTVRNCFFREFGSALYFQGGNNTNITNNTFYNSSHTDVVFGDTAIMQNLNFVNNTVRFGFDNGIEDFGSNNTLYDQNILGDHRAGHNTSRSFQFVRNNNNVTVSNNFFANSTNCMRFDNVNISNILVINNQCLDIRTNGLNYQVGSGVYLNITFNGNNFTNVGYPTSTTASADISLAASLTPAYQCANTTFTNNLVSLGKPFIFLNALNNSQTISNIDAGGMLLCNADNVILNNVTLTSLSNNYGEFVLTENLTLTNYTATNIRIAIRAGGLANSSISNIITNGSTLVAFNFAGATNIGNNISNFIIRDTLVQGGISLGGSNNTFQHGIIANSSTVSSAIGVTSTTAGAGNLLSNISVYNMPLGFLFQVSSGNTFQNLYFENTTQSVLINSSASGTKTLLIKNTTVAFSGGVNRTTFDLNDTIAASEQYRISPQANPFSFNSSYVTFLNKTMNISNLGVPNVSIEELNMTWSDQDSITFDENRLGWWYNNGAVWTKLIATLDATNNRLSYSSYVVNSGESLLNELWLQDMCPLINVSGVYFQKQNYLNATNPSAPFLEYSCLDIRASDVVWDCQGFNITNSNFTNITTGILAVGNNITTQNCNVSGYSYQEYANGNNIRVLNNRFNSGGQANTVGYSIFLANGGTIFNNSFTNLTTGVLFFFGTVNYNVSNNLFSINTVTDIDAAAATGSTLSQNNHTSGNIGVAMLNGNTNHITYSNFTSMGFMPIQLTGTDTTNISNNRIVSSSYGIDLSSGSDSNQISSNLVTTTIFGDQISISGGTGNTINLNNVTSGTANGIFLSSTSSTNTISNNIVTGNIQIGIRVEGATNTVANNTLTSNGQGGFAAFNTPSVTVFNNTATLNSAGFLYQNASGSTSSFNRAINNSVDGGFVVQGNGGSSENNSFTNDTSINNTGSGFQFDSDTFSNNITNCTITGSAGMFGSGISMLGRSGRVNSCTISTSVLVGILVEGNNSIVENNEIFSNNPSNTSVGFIPGGIAISNAINTTLTSNIIRNNPTGIVAYISTGNTMSGNTIHTNSMDGLLSVDSNVTSTTDSYYGNTLDILVNNTLASTLTLSSAQFRNPAGTPFNATTLSLSDSILGGDAYSISYTTNTNPISTGNLSVENATILILKYPNMSINSMTWTYNPGSLNSSQENSIVAWDFNGTWTSTSSSVNTAANTVTLLAATAPGNYTLLYDINGIVPPPPPAGGGYVIPFLPQPYANGTNGTNITTPQLTSGMNQSANLFDNLKNFAYENNQFCLPVVVILIILFLLRGRK